MDTYGHIWGNFDDEVSKKYPHAFTRIIAANPFWLSGEHENLVKSMLYFLDDKNPDSRVIAVAGMHTRRRTVPRF